MKSVLIYTKTVCPYCAAAKNLFERLGAPYREVNLDGDPALRDELTRRHRWRTVPMIFVGDEFLGGFDDVRALHQAGGLVPKLQD
jgi:glutaredoxin 3